MDSVIDLDKVSGRGGLALTICLDFRRLVERAGEFGLQDNVLGLRYQYP